jgi:hypothetical protein
MVFPTDSPWKDNLLSLPRLSFQYSDVCPTTTSTPPSHSSCQVLVHVDSLAIASHLPSEGTSTDFVSGASTISLLTDRCYNRAGYWPDTSFDVLLLSCDIIMGIANTVDRCRLTRRVHRLAVDRRNTLYGRRIHPPSPPVIMSTPRILSLRVTESETAIELIDVFTMETGNTARMFHRHLILVIRRSSRCTGGGIRDSISGINLLKNSSDLRMLTEYHCE